ncbi:MAG: Gfo/Idh/MocA family protein [Planctomycetaceae bacterium]
MPASRRDFVSHAVLMATGALATRAAAPRRSEAAEPEPATRPTGPAETLRVAVIGLNGQGGAHVDNWLDTPGCALVAVCDCDPAASAKQIERIGRRAAKPSRLPEAVVDVRRLLDRDDIDAVSIATPNHWHALMAIWAMQAGKDVYVEKPCSHTVEEGRAIVEWARKLGKMCQMGVQSRSMTGMRETLAFVTGGAIGPVRVARAICYRRRDSIGLVDTPAPLPPGLDFDLWAGPAPAVVPKRRRLHYDWHWNKLTGNGDIGNQNPHELDKARWGLGKQELPRRVVSLGGRLGYVDNGDVANSQVTIYQWDDALLISDVRGLPIETPVTFGLQGGPFNGACNIWYGTDGYAVGPNYSSGIAFDYDGRELGRWSGGTYQAHFANFVTAIRSRDHRDLHLDILDGHLSSALAHLGNVSWALGEHVEKGEPLSLGPFDFPFAGHVGDTLAGFGRHLDDNDVDLDATPLSRGRELVIDPATERSTDPAANILFGREYRAGYELPRI